MKVVNTSDIEIVQACLTLFGFALYPVFSCPSVQQSSTTDPPTNPRRIYIYIVEFIVNNTEWPIKVNHYQESSLNRIKTTACVATFFINFEYKMSKRMLYIFIKYSMRDLIYNVINCSV